MEDLKSKKQFGNPFWNIRTVDEEWNSLPDPHPRENQISLMIQLVIPSHFSICMATQVYEVIRL
jgi:hypothetical protein